MSDKNRIIKHGNHIVNDMNNGYMYNLNFSRCYDFNSHMHNCYEFIHIINGQLIYTVEGTEYMLSDGDIIMTRPDELHSFSFPNECDYRREFLHIYPGFIKDYPELTQKLNDRKAGNYNRIPSEYVTKYGIDKLFDSMEECCDHADADTDLLMLAYTIELIVKISRILITEVFKEHTPVTNKKASAVCRYIDHHCFEQITVENIANELFVSPGHLCRLFKSETGMTIKTYLNMRRITRAKNMIMEGHSIMKNIYPACGYNDYSTFYRAFVKYTGISPESFRNTQNSLTAL
ncbi:MAG: helix-turn-helix transcriptional regulator [Clostridia bacterium]|nr:helix-turn-helix transcriptional regulator [Clostridia bacterium]